MKAAALGSPIAHSLSPALHNAGYDALGLTDWEYGLFEVGIAQLADFIANLDDSWRGLSLTMPLKAACVAVADEVSPLAAHLGVANTLIRGGDGSWRADNTDVSGIVSALTPYWDASWKQATILGGGATAKTALFALRELGVRRFDVFARDPQKAAANFALSGVSISEPDVGLDVESGFWHKARMTGAHVEVPVSSFRHSIPRSSCCSFDTFNQLGSEKQKFSVALASIRYGQVPESNTSCKYSVPGVDPASGLDSVPGLDPVPDRRAGVAPGCSESAPVLRPGMDVADFTHFLPPTTHPGCDAALPGDDTDDQEIEIRFLDLALAGVTGASGGAGAVGAVETAEGVAAIRTMGDPGTAEDARVAGALTATPFVINALPAGVVTAFNFAPQTQLAMDVTYADWPTPFAQAAQVQGVRVISGLEMLLWQAVKQFELFTQHPAPVAAMAAALGLTLSKGFPPRKGMAATQDIAKELQARAAEGFAPSKGMVASSEPTLNVVEPTLNRE